MGYFKERDLHSQTIETVDSRGLHFPRKPLLEKERLNSLCPPEEELVSQKGILLSSDDKSVTLQDALNPRQ